MKLKSILFYICFTITVPTTDATEIQTSVTTDLTPAHCPYYKPGTKHLYFGDLHVHTSMSCDAASFFTRNDPADAYAFAKGESVPIYECGKPTDRKKCDRVSLPENCNKRDIQIERPLDFTAVTDHAESLSVDDWKAIQKATELANDPCTFTAFKGYEWGKGASTQYGSAMLHRNVIFNGSSVPPKVFDRISHKNSIDLFHALEKSCKTEDGCKAFTIPHNSNMSQGLHFKIENKSRTELKLRKRYDKLTEIYQHKQSSECLTVGDDVNGDCAFENWINFGEDKKRREDVKQNGFVRGALEHGLEYFEKSDPQPFNPLQLGIIASTDTHNGSPGYTNEKTWQGHTSTRDFSPERRIGSDKEMRFGSGGLVGVWAEENTRTSIFNALSNREVYGTSGPRISLKFFQVWSDDDYCKASNPIPTEIVPMGSEMAMNSTKKPKFVIFADKDQTDLQSIEVIKGYLKNGKAVSEVLTIENAGKDGQASMCKIWMDKSYDPTTPAFWYVRIKELPTWRWSHRDCEYLRDKCLKTSDKKACSLVAKCDDPLLGLDIQIQERAWSSPIWNLPE